MIVGEEFMGPGQTRGRPRRNRKKKALTRMEIAVLRLVAIGCSERAIAQRMGRSVRAISVHCFHLRQKFKVDSVRQLPLYAFALGLCDQEVLVILGYARKIDDVPFPRLALKDHHARTAFFGSKAHKARLAIMKEAKRQKEMGAVPEPSDGATGGDE